MSFWKELKRRNVYKVGVAYAIVAWLIIQAVSITFPVLHLPGWAVTLVTVLVIIGFPFALLFAWAFEVTPEGIKRTKEVPLSESITHLTGQKLNYIVTGLLVVAVAALVVDNYLLDKDAIEPEVVSTETEQAPVVADVEEEAPKTIAVLPFDDLSPEKDQEYFVLGLSEEILNSLAQISDLTVIAKTSSFSFKGTNQTIQEIASVLGVVNILEGSVRKAGNSLRITAQLVKAVDGSHLWSKTYDKEFKVEEIFSVQEDIAKAVARELKTTLGIDDSIKILGGTDNQEAYELYLIALGGVQIAQTFQNFIDAFNPALSSINAAIELDPQFALAWSFKSFIHKSILMYGHPINADAERDTALKAALMAIELQPTLWQGYAALGDIKETTGELIEAALAYDKAAELNFGSLWDSDYTVLLETAAYLNKAQELLEEARRVDPLNRLVRLKYIANLGLHGDIEQAEKENERCMAIFGHDWIGNVVLNIVRLGSGQAVTREQIVIVEFLETSTINGEAREYLDSPEEGLIVLRRFYNKADNLSAADLNTIAFWAAYFGDPEFAMDSIEKTISTGTGGSNDFWYPLFKEVRQLPRFKELIKEIGLIDYWNKFGWPDICHQLDNGDFECD